MNRLIMLFTAVLLSTSVNAASPFAPRPLSITSAGTGVTDAGLAYTNYNVKCSNRRSAPVTAWQGSGQWCAADGSGNCSRDKIKAAVAACKLRPIDASDSNGSMIGKR